MAMHLGLLRMVRLNEHYEALYILRILDSTLED